ncbi:hypothetical protein [Hoeflea sp.]|uniref:hypothetical protein n=1 Tax=Hoeflea sp. TaxID=1940281 RepID=UPI003B5155D3
MTDIHHPQAPECPASRILARQPENLVVGGYRGWLHFASERNVSHLRKVQSDYVRLLGEQAGTAAMGGLERLIGNLGACANCPLRFFCQGSKHLCREECLMLALVSGLQNGDEEAALLSARFLSSSSQAPELLSAAAEFAMTLKFAGQQLLPIHAHTVDQFGGATRAPHPTLH